MKGIRFLIKQMLIRGQFSVVLNIKFTEREVQKMLSHSVQSQNPLELAPRPGYYTERAQGPLLDKVFSMRYRSYSEAGHIDPCVSGKFMDEYDGRPNSKSYLLYGQKKKKKKPVGSIRVCMFDPKESHGVPAMEMYRDEIKKEIGYENRFVEVNRFVIDPRFQRLGGMQARFRIFELGVDKALEAGASCILVAVRPEHVRFYKMLFGRPISESKPYHNVKFNTVLVACTEIEKTKEFISSKLFGKNNEPTFNYSAN
eukprot:TRINITY_DN46708_c0_g1_i5.p3 TRINITY_DN46708_c0_g1~~TRINITY_DN46708_c0_g1_i5.p3  ORF type:complete len:256 (-),score=7.10 TRINITY_DN46708_c0_g1_i5:633-1400(-)